MDENHLFFLRHCQSLYNVQGKISGQSDCHIIHAVVDCSNLEEIISSQDVIIISSPLSRCLDTVKLLQNSISKHWPIIVNRLIIERGMGEWEGKERAIIVKQFPEYFHNEKLILYLTPAGGEPYINFKNRTVIFVDGLKKLLRKKHVIVCSHNQTLRMITALITNKDYNSIPTYQNGIVTKIF